MHLDLAHARRAGREVQRVNIDVSVDLLRAIDREEERIGKPRHAFQEVALDWHSRECSLVWCPRTEV